MKKIEEDIWYILMDLYYQKGKSSYKFLNIETSQDNYFIIKIEKHNEFKVHLKVCIIYSFISETTLDIFLYPDMKRIKSIKKDLSTTVENALTLLIRDYKLNEILM